MKKQVLTEINRQYHSLIKALKRKKKEKRQKKRVKKFKEGTMFLNTNFSNLMFHAALNNKEALRELSIRLYYGLRCPEDEKEGLTYFTLRFLFSFGIDKWFFFV